MKVNGLENKLMYGLYVRRCWDCKFEEFHYGVAYQVASKFEEFHQGGHFFNKHFQNFGGNLVGCQRHMGIFVEGRESTVNAR